MALASRLRLGTRIAILAVLSLAVIFSLFGYLSLRSLRESSDREMQARLMAAQLSAHHIDNFLSLYLDMLGRSAKAGHLDPSDQDPGPRQRLLQQLYSPRVEISTAIFLMDQNGMITWAEPAEARTDQIDPPVQDVAESIVRTRTPLVSDAFRDRLGRTVVALGVPVLGRQSEPAGALVLVLDLSGSLLSGFIQPVLLGETGFAEIVDSKGTVLASSKPSLLFQKSDHTDQFADMIRADRPTVGGCHSCHDAGGGSTVQPDMLAFAPLEVAPWGVAIRQSEEEVLAPTRALQRALVEVSILVLAAAVAMVWLVTRTVVGPIRGLTGAARRIAAGNLKDPVACVGPAEVGELAREFDGMREELRVSLHNLEQVKASLEQRVEQRTRQLSALLDKVIVAQEEERRRIARELHDDTCQSLAALAISLEAVGERLPKGAEEVRTQLSRVKAQVRDTLGEVRTLALNLRPSVLDDLGLAMAIDWYARDQLSKRGLEVRLELDGVDGQLSPSLETVLFRITQEALNNVVKHADTSSATVRLGIEGSRVVLEVEDRGRGFEAERVMSPSGPRDCLGLHSMRERATLSGGFLKVVSRPGQGTTVRAELPLEWTRDDGHEEDLCIAGG